MRFPAFNYSITANDSPVTFSAAGLPGGLTVNTNTGTISGTPTETGLFNVVLGARDSHGNVGNATLAVNIAKVNTTVSLGNLSRAYDGAGHSVSKTTTPGGLAVNTTYNGLNARTDQCRQLHGRCNHRRRQFNVGARHVILW